MKYVISDWETGIQVEKEHGNITWLVYITVDGSRF